MADPSDLCVPLTGVQLATLVAAGLFEVRDGSVVMVDSAVEAVAAQRKKISEQRERERAAAAERKRRVRSMSGEKSRTNGRTDQPVRSKIPDITPDTNPVRSMSGEKSRTNGRTDQSPAHPVVPGGTGVTPTPVVVSTLKGTDSSGLPVSGTEILITQPDMKEQGEKSKSKRVGNQNVQAFIDAVRLQAPEFTDSIALTGQDRAELKGTTAALVDRLANGYVKVRKGRWGTQFLRDHLSITELLHQIHTFDQEGTHHGTAGGKPQGRHAGTANGAAGRGNGSALVDQLYYDAAVVNGTSQARLRGGTGSSGPVH